MNGIILPTRFHIDRTGPRKPYHCPQLIDLGDLRSLTLGGSPGELDSGTPTTSKPIGAKSMPYFDPLSGESADPYELPQP